MIKRILLGLGGTSFTDVAIERALELAQLHNALVTGVTVVDVKRLTQVGPVPPGGGAYAARLREKRLNVTLVVRHLLGDTVLNAIQQSDRPLFLAQ